MNNAHLVLVIHINIIYQLKMTVVFVIILNLEPTNLCASKIYVSHRMLMFSTFLSLSQCVCAQAYYFH